MIPNKFVILWDNIPVGLDSGSGGYPFKTTHPGSIKYWETKKQADDYLDVITSHHTSKTYIQNYRVVEIQFRIMNK